MAERTSLYSQHVERGARMVEFGGYLMPQQYTSIRDEHLAVRQSAGIFDLSHMGRLHVRGDDALHFLQRMLTNDLSRIAPGRAQYTLLCSEEGGILDDLVVYWREDHFLVVVNASTREKDVAWLREHLPSGVSLEDVTHDVSLIALQGPRAQLLLPTSADLTKLPYFGVMEAEVAGVQCTVSRTGYTGEDGFEIFMAADDASRVWSALLEVTPPGAVLPCGLGARDVCRLEAGLRLYGSDMDESTNPYDAGLGWTVRLQKEDFIGRPALQRVKEHGAEWDTHGIKLSGRAIPRHGLRVKKQGAEVGEVTSGTFSFFLNQGIGMLRVKRGTAAPGDAVLVDMRGQANDAEVAELPFYRGSVKVPAATRTSV